MKTPLDQIKAAIYRAIHFLSIIVMCVSTVKLAESRDIYYSLLSITALIIGTTLYTLVQFKE